MAGLDLATFKPDSADALLHAILSQVGGVVAGDIARFRSVCGHQLARLAETAWDLRLGLAEGEISPDDAQVALRTQTLFLSNILLQADFLSAVVAQDALDAVISVVTAAIRNLTGAVLKL